MAGSAIAVVYNQKKNYVQKTIRKTRLGACLVCPYRYYGGSRAPCIIDVFQLQLFYLSNMSCYLVQIAFYVGAYYCEAVLDDPKPL